MTKDIQLFKHFPLEGLGMGWFGLFGLGWFVWVGLVWFVWVGLCFGLKFVRVKIC